jgi:uncharacterized RmlC-like cupin family protein
MQQEQRVTRVTAQDRVEDDPTPGMTRERAIATDGMWAGFVRTGPRTSSGWHHHGEHDSSIYVVRGTIRLESGPHGSEVVEATAGDFVHVPKGTVHRESNPDDEESQLVVVRAGHGPTVVNVSGPSES